MGMLKATVLLILIIKDTLGQNESSIQNSSSIQYMRPVTFHWPSIYGRRVAITTLDTYYLQVKKRIVNFHNYFRIQVNPPASNMLEMKWHRGAAYRARIWAEQCKFQKNDFGSDRYVRNFGNCGQNVYASPVKLEWFSVVEKWFLENANFTYGSEENILDNVGRYTQMVWATTHKVGCHITWCPSGASWGGMGFYNYVCDYCPTGNWAGRLGTPYKTGNSCDLCPESCKYGGLCTNYCPYTDRFSNCHNHSRGWLCDGEDEPGRSRFNHCRATCTCKNKIHEWL